MPRIAGIDIPDHKKTRFALRSLYGIGPSNVEDVLRESNVDGDKRGRDLTTDELNRIQRVLEKYNIEGNLRRLINDNIDRLKRVKSYRGMRHMMGLPARGQRTKTNARTRKGGKKTVGAMTKEMAAKLDAAKKAK
jgi:small subunit ribosomal protein S13